MMNIQEVSDLVTQAISDHGKDAAQLLAGTIILTVAMEVWCIDTVKGVLSQPNGKDLYARAIAANFLYLFLLGVPGFIISCMIAIDEQGMDIHRQIFSVVCVLLGHGAQYYVIHKAFHEYPALYKYHKFHHQFNVYAPPSAANAVSFTEYSMAYVTPFIITTLIFPLDKLSLTIGAGILSTCNILVHTPKLEAWAQRVLPEWWVTTHDHLEHHRKQQCHYSSPTFDFDYIVEVANNALSTLNAGSKSDLNNPKATSAASPVR